MRFLDVPIVVVLVSVYSPLGKLLKRLTTPYLQVLPILYSLSMLLPPPCSTQHMHLRDRGLSYTLPTCTLQLYKNSLLIDACLVINIVWWFYVSFFVICITHLSFHFTILCMRLSCIIKRFLPKDWHGMQIFPLPGRSNKAYITIAIWLRYVYDEKLTCSFFARVESRRMEAGARDT